MNIDYFNVQLCLECIIVVNNENTVIYFQIYVTYRQFARNHDAVRVFLKQVNYVRNPTARLIYGLLSV